MSATLSEPDPVKVFGTADALARLAHGRDSDAWSAILQRHGIAVLRLAQRITGDASLCDDVCQETLLQIREHAAQFKAPGTGDKAEAAARGWIMCIAYRTALGMLRLRQRRSETEFQAGLELPRATGTPDLVLAAEDLARIRGEVAGLPELLRSAVSLHYYGELSYLELSTALDCSEKAARKRVERGLTRLRDRLAAGGAVVSLGTLLVALGAPARACEAGAATVSLAPVSEILSTQRFATWQALLHHSTPPLLASAAKTGGLVLMTKFIVGAAAALLFGVSAVQNYRLGVLSEELAATRQQAGQVGALQQKLEAVEKQVDLGQGEVAALKANLAIRNEEAAQMQSKLRALEPAPNVATVHSYGPTTAFGRWTFDAAQGLAAQATGNNAGVAGGPPKMGVGGGITDVTTAHAIDANGNLVTRVVTPDGKIVTETIQPTTFSTAAPLKPDEKIVTRIAIESLDNQATQVQKAAELRVQQLQDELHVQQLRRALTAPPPIVVQPRDLPSPFAPPGAVKPPKPPKENNENF